MVHGAPWRAVDRSDRQAAPARRDTGRRESVPGGDWLPTVPRPIPHRLSARLRRRRRLRCPGRLPDRGSAISVISEQGKFHLATILFSNVTGQENSVL